MATDFLFGILKRDPETEAEQFGVKGQKWGVTRKRTGYIKAAPKKSFGDRRAERVADNVHARSATTTVYDKKGRAIEGAQEAPVFRDHKGRVIKGARSQTTEKLSTFDAKYNRVYSKSAGQIKKETKALNEKYAGNDFTRDSPTRKKYYDEYASMAERILNANAVGNFNTVNRRYALDFTVDPAQSRPEVTLRAIDNLKAERADAKTALGKDKQKEIKHASDDVWVVVDASKVELDFDDDGYILGPRDEDVIAQSGVKGMRWGFRKATTRGGTPPSKRKAKPDEGEDSGPKQTPSAKKSVKSLSDQELKDRIQRLQNEKAYKQLIAKPENVVAGILKRSAKAAAEQALTQVSTKLLKQALGAGAEKLLSKKASDTIKDTSMDDFAKVFAEAKKSAPSFKIPETPKKANDPGTPGNPIFFTATRGDTTPRPTIKLKEIGR